ncbi:MAG: YeeE/YedE family protein [Alphaproteobacteria bacterium]
MVRNLSALAAGILFGLGLAVSEMVNPLKVKAFLDVAGSWDPSLILVMGSAVVVTFVAFRFILKRSVPFYGSAFDLPASERIDRRLIGGAAVFGAGWGLVGLCPGPAISGLVGGQTESYVFIAAMILGLLVGPKILAVLAPLSAAPSTSR